MGGNAGRQSTGAEEPAPADHKKDIPLEEGDLAGSRPCAGVEEPVAADHGGGIPPDGEDLAGFRPCAGAKGRMAADHERGITLEEKDALVAFLLSPDAATEGLEGGRVDAGVADIRKLTREELEDEVRRHVPGAPSMMDRTGSYPVCHYMWMTYENGLPIYRGNQAVQDHTIHAIRYIFSCAITGSPPGASDAIKRLAEAYQSCQAEQGRTIDHLYGKLTGRDASLRGQVLALVDTFKSLTLESVVHDLNPTAAGMGDASPGLQVPHITSAYLEAVGGELGLRGVAAARSDYMRPRGVRRERILEAFRATFSLDELAGALVSDVNQQASDAERVIDRDLLAKWAGEAAQASDGAFDAHAIYFDEGRAGDYEGQPEESGKYQPYLSLLAAKQVLVQLFLRGGSEEAEEREAEEREAEEREAEQREAEQREAEQGEAEPREGSTLASPLGGDDALGPRVHGIAGAEGLVEGSAAEAKGHGDDAAPVGSAGEDADPARLETGAALADQPRGGKPCPAFRPPPRT